MCNRSRTMSFQEKGFAVFDNLLPSSECDDLASRVNLMGPQSAGSRCLLDHDWCRKAGDQLRVQLARHFDCVRRSVIVQCTYFHKADAKNWLVPWHQDRSISVLSQVESDELTGWSCKEEMTFVHGPEDVLASMFALRLHLDDSTLHNGPLRVLPGSHRNGTLSPEQMKQVRKSTPETTCVVPKGGVLVMRPLLLHASSKSTIPAPRRVLHFLFGPAQLPHGLAWRHAV